MHRLHEVATHKLGRASFALAGLLDAEDHLENLKAEARLDPVFSASLHVTLIALRDAAFLIDSHALAAWSVGVVDVAEMPKRCLVTANLSEVGDRLAHRGAARFFEAMTRRTEIQEVAYSS